MAQRRMFSLKVVDTDAFLEMPASTQALYFHLAMRADDDGFVPNPRKIMRMIATGEDEYKILIAKRFILPFDSGVCVIKHWLIHNLVRSDRYSPTQWTRERQMLQVDEDTKKYRLADGIQNVIPNGDQPAPQVRLGKDRKERAAYGEFKNVFLATEDHADLCERFGRSAVAKYIEEMSTYQKAKSKRYSDYKAALINWMRKKGVVETKPAPQLSAPKEQPISAEENAKIEKTKREISAKFSRKSLAA